MKYLFVRANEDMFITSIRDSLHLPHSFHYIGDAVDIRRPEKVSIHEIRNVLGNYFDVVEKPSHFHLEFDPG